MSLVRLLEKLSAKQRISLALGLVLILGVMDQATGYELSSSFFYLGPVAIAAWYVSNQFGLLVAVLCAVVWALADVAGGHVYSNPLVFYWNGFVRLGTFVTVAGILARLRLALQTEQRLARTDFLTQTYNSRYFFELAEREVVRCRRYRHTLSLAYIDLDNFKQVNDRLGHAAGDLLLQQIAQIFVSSLRESDSVARLGGDEFAFLLPETDGAGARQVIKRVTSRVNDLLLTQDFRASCSIGVVSCTQTYPDVPELVRIADRAMYQAKAEGKGRAVYLSCTPPD